MNRLILVATAKVKGFQRGKACPGSLGWDENQVENKTTQGSFLQENSETKHSTGSVTEGSKLR